MNRKVLLAALLTLLTLAVGFTALPGTSKASSGEYFGLYRATVLDASDPMQQGRLYVDVPAAANLEAWALPCVAPSSAPQALPAIGSVVWVEFEQGNREYPVWMGSLSVMPVPVRE